MRRRWQWFIMAALILSSCDSSGQAPIASVKAVRSPAAFVNDDMAGAGDNIPKNATLATNNSGVLEFVLEDFLTTCQLRPESRIVTESSPNTAFRYERGAVWCQASALPQQQLAINVGVRQLHVTHARFGLKSGQVVVDSGEVIISDAGGGPDRDDGSDA